MLLNEDSTTRVLSIYPTVRGFGFSLLEGPQKPIDWGANTVRIKKNKISLDKIERLIDFYSPDIVVTEKAEDPASRRCERIASLLDDIEDLCDKKNQRIICYTRKAVADVFETFGVSTKHEIARKISIWLPSLAPYLPPPRKPWMSEDYRMAIFDAMALSMTYYYSEE